MNDYRDHRVLEDAWAVYGRQKKVLELAGRVGNVTLALSARNRSQADVLYISRYISRYSNRRFVIAIVIRRAYHAYSACLSDVP
jgi:hypothetical protein